MKKREVHTTQYIHMLNEDVIKVREEKDKKNTKDSGKAAEVKGTKVSDSIMLTPTAILVRLGNNLSTASPPKKVIIPINPTQYTARFAHLRKLTYLMWAFLSGLWLRLCLSGTFAKDLGKMKRKAIS